MDKSTRPVLPLIATALLAALVLVRGILHPQLNYDVIPYTALSKEMRGNGGKAEAYRELAAKVGSRRFQLYVSGSYRERMYADDKFFQANLPFYRIRPFYISLCSVVGSLVHSDVAATYIVSAVAAALAVLLSCAIAGTVGLRGNWLLAVPLTWITAGGLNLAGLSTPDALATLVSLLFVQTSIAGPWRGARTIFLILLAVLMVTTRTDIVLLVAILMLHEGLVEPHHRLIALLVFLAGLSTYLVIQEHSGNYGYIAILNFALVDGSHDVAPNLVPNLHGYLLIIIHQLLQILGEEFQQALLFLAVSLLVFAWYRERRLREAQQADELNQRALILSGALALYLVTRFVLFPSPIARFMMNAYVLAGILFARAIQPNVPTTQSEPSPGPPRK